MPVIMVPTPATSVPSPREPCTSARAHRSGRAHTSGRADSVGECASEVCEVRLRTFEDLSRREILRNAALVRDLEEARQQIVKQQALIEVLKQQLLHAHTQSTHLRTDHEHIHAHITSTHAASDHAASDHAASEHAASEHARSQYSPPDALSAYSQLAPPLTQTLLSWSQATQSQATLSPPTQVVAGQRDKGDLPNGGKLSVGGNSSVHDSSLYEFSRDRGDIHRAEDYQFMRGMLKNGSGLILRRAGALEIGAKLGVQARLDRTVALEVRVFFGNLTQEPLENFIARVDLSARQGDTSKGERGKGERGRGERGTSAIAQTETPTVIQIKQQISTVRTSYGCIQS